MLGLFWPILRPFWAIAKFFKKNLGKINISVPRRRQDGPRWSQAGLQWFQDDPQKAQEFIPISLKKPSQIDIFVCGMLFDLMIV